MPHNIMQKNFKTVYIVIVIDITTFFFHFSVLLNFYLNPQVLLQLFFSSFLYYPIGKEVSEQLYDSCLPGFTTTTSFLELSFLP